MAEKNKKKMQQLIFKSDFCRFYPIDNNNHALNGKHRNRKDPMQEI